MLRLYNGMCLCFVCLLTALFVVDWLLFLCLLVWVGLLVLLGCVASTTGGLFILLVFTCRFGLFTVVICIDCVGLTFVGL